MFKSECAFFQELFMSAGMNGRIEADLSRVIEKKLFINFSFVRAWKYVRKKCGEKGIRLRFISAAKIKWNEHIYLEFHVEYAMIDVSYEPASRFRIIR